MELNFQNSSKKNSQKNRKRIWINWKELIFQVHQKHLSQKRKELRLILVRKKKKKKEGTRHKSLQRKTRKTLKIKSSISFKWLSPSLTII